MERTTRRTINPLIGGCGCGNGCLGFLIFNLILGGIACRYCLMHWLPGLHNMFPTAFNMPPAHMNLWPGPILLGLIGGELFIPGAIITWLLISMGIVSL